MRFKRKESSIIDWWLAEENLKMAFIDLHIGKVSNKKMVVVGFKKKKGIIAEFEVINSTDYVERITKKGVITEGGTFYPYNDAHALYLKFLIELRQKDTLTVTNWEFVRYKGIMSANIFKDGKVKEKITFDFIPDKTEILFTGYSKELKTNILLMPFAPNNVGEPLNISESIIANIYNSSFIDEEERKILISRITKFNAR